MRTYKNELAKKQKSGASFERTNTFDRMEDMLSNRHDIKPKATFGTGVKRAVGEDSKEEPQFKKRNTNSPTEYRGKRLEKLDSTVQYFK